MSSRRKLCYVTFDEITLRAGLIYDVKEDRVHGFHDGYAEKIGIADHAMVVMVRGVAESWKQPLCYYLCANGMSHAEIKTMLKDVIAHLQRIGLNVLATVCDQGNANRAALRTLREETVQSYTRRNEECRHEGFEVGGKEIIPLYDVPHLLKSVRNNLLRKTASFSWRHGEQVASWRHFMTLYDVDRNAADKETRSLPRLEDYHVYESQIRKMKVKVAAQAMSESVAAIMRLVTRSKYPANVFIFYSFPHLRTFSLYFRFSHFSVVRGLPEEAYGTASFFLFFDKLFDSLNGQGVRPKESGDEKYKELRQEVRDGSPHHTFWAEALRVLNDMRFNTDTGMNSCTKGYKFSRSYFFTNSASSLQERHDSKS